MSDTQTPAEAVASAPPKRTMRSGRTEVAMYPAAPGTEGGDTLTDAMARWVQSLPTQTNRSGR